MVDPKLLDAFEKMQAKLEELTRQVEEQRRIAAEQQEKIARLEGPPTSPSPVRAAPSVRTTSRRRMLGKMAAALVAGVAVNASLAGQPARARLLDITPGDGKVGAFAVPPGSAIPTGTPPSIYNGRYGLVGSDGYDPTFDLTRLPSFGAGVYGNGRTYGVYGNSNGYGVYGNGIDTGVYGEGIGTGVYGNGDTNGVYGNGLLNGIYGYGDTGAFGTGSNIGVKGIGGFIGVYAENSQSPDILNPRKAFLATPALAGDFYGDVHVNGTLVKKAGSFRIDHPLDPANKYLSHSFVESPDMLNIYDGVVILDSKGEATVTLPDWFEALNRDFRYQLTPIGKASPNLFILEEVSKHSFKIGGGQAWLKVSWMVTGIRQDTWANAHRIPVEEEKSKEEKGLSLHPAPGGESK